MYVEDVFFCVEWKTAYEIRCSLVGSERCIRGRERSQGDARPGPPGGVRRSDRVEAQGRLIKALVDATPDITVEVLRAAVAEHGHIFGYCTF